ncbi:MAG: DUF898 domain-containing protein [Chlorobi bacterium]|nr:DUF898 domain-containing protein [Chlorobiota bacterium]
MTENNTEHFQPNENEGESETRKIPIQFIGSPGEYWKIYMINLALTILTLGLYRPWAKVRQYKYLYNHLLVDGSPMDFTAKPIRLLIGQLIVMFFIGLYFYSQITLNTYLAAILSFSFVVLMPLLLWLSYRFFFRYTQWSGVSMSFTASKSEFYFAVIGRGILSLFIITFPIAQKKWFEFIGRNVFWGNKRLSVNASLEKLYTGFGLYIGMLATGFYLLWLLITIVGGDEARMQTMTTSQKEAFAIAVIGGLIIYLVFILWGYSFMKSYTVHAIYHGLKIGEAKLKLRIKPFKLAWEYVKMYLFTFLSFGIAYPYLFARLLSQIANNSHLELPEGEDLIAHEVDSGQVSAVGMEAIDEVGLDVDFDIGF